MTMRTRTNYACECGAIGHSVLSENDQPYSKPWEQETFYGGIDDAGRDEAGRRQFRCAACGRTGRVSVVR